MRESIVGQVVNAIGPLKSSRELQELAEQESIKNGGKGPSHINPFQALTREIIRDVAHPLFLRNETSDQFGGLKRLHELQQQGMGAVVVEMHFSQIDPLWAIHAVTQKLGNRSIPAVQPIAADRALPGLLSAARASGLEIVKVVTPDVKERANKKNPNNNVKVGEGQDEYIHKAVEVVREGGLAFVPPKATREKQLKQSERDQAVTSLLLSKLYLGGVRDVAVHFVAFDMDGIKDAEGFNKRRKYNIGKKHSVIHGNTFTLEELINLAAGDVIDGEKERRRALRGLTLMEAVVYNELKKIVPQAYIPEEDRDNLGNQIAEPHELPNDNRIHESSEQRRQAPAPASFTPESVSADLIQKFDKIPAEQIRAMVDKRFAVAKPSLAHHISSIVEKELRDLMKEIGGSS